MRVHLRDRVNLSQVDVLAVAERDDFVKAAQQLERVPVNLSSVGGSANGRNNPGNQLKGVDVYSG